MITKRIAANADFITSGREINKTFAMRDGDWGFAYQPYLGKKIDYDSRSSTIAKRPSVFRLVLRKL